MAFHLFLIQENCTTCFELGKQTILLVFPSLWFEPRVTLRELFHTMYLMNPKTTVWLLTSVPQGPEGLPLPRQRSQVLKVFLCPSSASLSEGC